MTFIFSEVLKSYNLYHYGEMASRGFYVFIILGNLGILSRSENKVK